MIFELKVKKDKLLEGMYKKAMQELGGFFKLNWIYNQPNIIILKNREEINKI